VVALITESIRYDKYLAQFDFIGIIRSVNYKKIIADAWHLTQERKELFWWFAFIPAVLSSLVSVVYLAYQFFSFAHSDLFKAKILGTDVYETVFIVAKNLLSEQTGLAVFLIMIAAIVFLAYLMLPVFTQGALIQLLAKIRAGQKVSMLEGISFGFSRFLQLFEYHLAIKTFSVVSLLTEAALVLRMLGLDAFMFFIWILLLFGAIGLVLSVLFTYSEFFIVIDNKGVFRSMLSSGALVIRHWHHTLFMFILMVIISVRIIINILIALLIPILVIAPVFLFASLTLVKMGVIVGAIIGLIALYFAAYFMGVFEVFATAVWTFTFLELTSKADEDDGATLREQIKAQGNKDS
jgi:hypothetical protein